MFKFFFEWFVVLNILKDSKELTLINDGNFFLTFIGELEPTFLFELFLYVYGVELP